MSHKSQDINAGIGKLARTTLSLLETMNRFEEIPEIKNNDALIVFNMVTHGKE